MRNTILLSALSLGLFGAVAGCGQTSYFEVNVQVKTTALGNDSTCYLSTVNSCEVKVSGADSSGIFTLKQAACTQPGGSNIGKFQFATEKDSGSLSFHLELFDGNHKSPPMGTGDASGPIKAGGRTVVTLEVTPQAGWTCP